MDMEGPEQELGYEDLTAARRELLRRLRDHGEPVGPLEAGWGVAERMEPVLHQQAQRPNFDIQEYGESILSQFEAIGEEVDATPVNGAKPVQVSFKEPSPRATSTRSAACSWPRCSSRSTAL